MNKVDQAILTFDDGYYCSQAILSAFSDELGIDKKSALKISSAFGGGIARTGDICGAVTGALMVLGLKFSSEDANNPKEKENIIAIAKKFLDEFRERNNSLMCKELLNCDLNTQEGRTTFKELNLRSTHCSKYIRDCAELLEKFYKELN